MLFKKLELKLELELELKLELELLLLSVSGSTRAGAYKTSADHKEDAWIAIDRWKHGTEQLLLCCGYGVEHVYQLHNCFDWIEGSEAY